MVILFSFTLFLNCFHLTLGDEFIVCSETANFVKVIGQFCSLICGDETLFFYTCKVHFFECAEYVVTGVSIIDAFLKVSVYDQGEKACEEMSFYPNVILKEYWSCFKVSFHDSH